MQFTCPTQDSSAVRYPPGSDGSTAGLQDPNNTGAGVGFPVVDCDGYASPLRMDGEFSFSFFLLLCLYEIDRLADKRTVHFPSCYDPSAGLDAYTKNMQFPSDAGGGKQDCPAGWTHLPHIFYEVYWDTPKYSNDWVRDGKTQPFVLASGDRTGFSVHGDFVAGWDVDVLGGIIDGCDAGDSGMDKCPNPGPLTDNTDNCQFPAAYPDYVEDWIEKLPGDNPVTGFGI